MGGALHLSDLEHQLSAELRSVARTDALPEDLELAQGEVRHDRAIILARPDDEELIERDPVRGTSRKTSL